MDVFVKSAAFAMICVVLYLVLSKQSKDIAVMLSIAACCIIASAAVAYLEPVLDFFRQLRIAGDLDPQLMEIVLKATGISVLSELCVMICADFGNAALGKTVQILSVAVILWMSLPLFMNLLELVRKVLGAV